MLRFMLSAMVGFTLTTGGVRADEPKPPGVYLEDLKYEILIAERRGQNVAAISDALDTFEKALAKNTKNATKVNGAPPELTALRDTVEAAAKKGENVEAISKELGIIEKALTGRAFERPKPVEPQVEPEPPPPPVPPLRMGRRPGGFGPNFGGGRRPGNPGGFNPGGFTPGGANPGVPSIHSTSVAVANGQFVIKSLQRDVTYTITGHTKENTTIKVVILVDEKKQVETDDLKKVPDEYRPTVEKLLKMVK